MCMRPGITLKSSLYNLAEPKGDSVLGNSFLSPTEEDKEVEGNKADEGVHGPMGDIPEVE